MSIDTVNERKSWVTTVSFTDEDGAAITPTSAQYKIDDVGSGAEVRTATAIDSLDEEVDITWEPTDTTILDESHLYELRRMTVEWQYGSPATLYGTEEYLLQVKNLRGISTPSPA
jgi:hypothetical protein